MPPKEKINTTTFWFMLIVSLGYDLIQIALGFIPVVGWILGGAIGIAAKLHLWLWYQFRGVTFFEKAVGRGAGRGARKLTQRLIIWWGSFLAEAIPLASLLPLLSVSVLATNLIVRAEDKAARSGSLSPEEIEELNRSLAHGNIRAITPVLARSLARRSGRKRLARSRERQALDQMEEMAAAG